MPGINNRVNNFIQNYNYQNKKETSIADNNPDQEVEHTKKVKLSSNETDSNKRYTNEKFFKPPLVIDSSNNMIYITHNGKSEMVLIDEGEYTLSELRVEILSKVDESFGAGKISLDLIGSGSDKLVNANKNYNTHIDIERTNKDEILEQLIKKEKEGNRILSQMENSISKMNKQSELIQKF